MTDVLKPYSREHWTDFVHGLPAGFTQPTPETDGSGSGKEPPTTAVGASPEEAGETPEITITPLDYDRPNPNSRFGVHHPQDVFISGFPSYGLEVGVYYCRITDRIDNTKELE